MLPDARIVHRLPGRLRIKFDKQKGDVAFFSMLCNELRTCPGVLDVTANPVTASALIQHAGGEPKVLQFAAAHRLFNVITSNGSPADTQARMAAGLGSFSRDLKRVSGGSMDLNALVVMGLTGLAIQQAIQGNIMAPALSLLWYAYSASRMTPVGREQQPGEPGDPASEVMKLQPPRGARQQRRQTIARRNDA
jgi:hypothetical protein